MILMSCILLQVTLTFIFLCEPFHVFKIYIDKILGESDVTKMATYIIPEFVPLHKKNN